MGPPEKGQFPAPESCKGETYNLGWPFFEASFHIVDVREEFAVGFGAPSSTDLGHGDFNDETRLLRIDGLLRWLEGFVALATPGITLTSMEPGTRFVGRCAIEQERVCFHSHIQRALVTVGMNLMSDARPLTKRQPCHETPGRRT